MPRAKRPKAPVQQAQLPIMGAPKQRGDRSPFFQELGRIAEEARAAMAPEIAQAVEAQWNRFLEQATAAARKGYRSTRFVVDHLIEHPRDHVARALQTRLVEHGALVATDPTDGAALTVTW